MGEPLQRVLSELEHGLAWVRQFHYIDIERILLAQQAYASDLRDGRQHRPLTELDGTEHDRFGPIDRTSVSQPTLFWTWLYSGMSAFYYGDIPYALRRFEEAAALTVHSGTHQSRRLLPVLQPGAGQCAGTGEVAENWNNSNGNVCGFCHGSSSTRQPFATNCC